MTGKIVRILGKNCDDGIYKISSAIMTRDISDVLQIITGMRFFKIHLRIMT